MTCFIRHSREGGNPEMGAVPLDPRLRGDDNVGGAK